MTIVFRNLSPEQRKAFRALKPEERKFVRSIHTGKKKSRREPFNPVPFAYGMRDIARAVTEAIYAKVPRDVEVQVDPNAVDDYTLQLLQAGTLPVHMRDGGEIGIVQPDTFDADILAKLKAGKPFDAWVAFDFLALGIDQGDGAILDRAQGPLFPRSANQYERRRKITGRAFVFEEDVRRAIDTDPPEPEPAAEPQAERIDAEPANTAAEREASPAAKAVLTAALDGVPEPATDPSKRGPGRQIGEGQTWDRVWLADRAAVVFEESAASFRSYTAFLGEVVREVPGRKANQSIQNRVRAVREFPELRPYEARNFRTPLAGKKLGRRHRVIFHPSRIIFHLRHEVITQ